MTSCARLRRALLWLAVVGALSSCAVGPDYVRPPLELPAQWRVSIEEVSDSASTRWWESLQDPQLNQLIAIALQNNYDLKVAAARVEQFYALYGIARADFFPQFELSASFSRNRYSPRGFPPSDGSISNQYSGRIGGSWELDLWGRIRRSTEAARADILAEEASRRGVILSVVAAVAQTYVELRELDKRLAITLGTLDSRRQSLKLANDRLSAGTSSELDVRQAESDLFAVEALIPALEADIATREHLLSVLLGRNPGGVERGKTIDELLVSLQVPLNAPSTVLDARPDVVAAEQALRAANARIGVAKAAYFPRLSLTGFFGYASEELSDWLRAPGRQWSYGPDVLLPLLQAGRIRNQVEFSEAQTREALAAYQRTVVTALQDVEDALVQFFKSKAQIQSQRSQVSSLQRYLELSQQRYAEGQTSYLEVLDAQRNLLGAQLSLSQSEGRQLALYFELFRAFGGGWVNEADAQAVQPEETVSLFP